MGYNLQSAITVLRRSWWLLLLAPLVGGGAGYFIADRQSPMYSASATLMVSAEPTAIRAEYQDVQIAQALTETFSALLLNRQVLQPIVDRHQSTISLEYLREHTTVGVSGGTLLNVGVASQDPVLAATLANEVASQFVKYSQTIPANSGDVTLTDSAVPPLSPYAPRVPVYVLLGAILGLLFASGAIFAADQLDTRHRSGKQLNGLRSLAVVPKISRMPRKRLQLFQQQDPSSLAAHSIRTLRAAVLESYTPGEVGIHRGQVIGCFSPNTSSGQSVVAANLALSLANSGTTVALVDLNFRDPSLGSYFGVSSKRGVASLLNSADRDWEDHSVPISDKLRLFLAGETSRNDADVLADPRMADVMLGIADSVDAVILDLPAADVSADSGLIARFMDSTILVAREGRTRTQALNALALELERAGTAVLGVTTTFGSSRRSGTFAPQPGRVGELQPSYLRQPVATSESGAYRQDERQFA